MSNVFKKRAEKLKAEYLQHVCERIQNRRKLGTPISPQEMETLYPMNSYERHHLMPLFDDELLLHELEYSLQHLTRSQERYVEHSLPSGATYSDNVLSLYLPMLIERFKKLKGEGCEEYEAIASALGEHPDSELDNLLSKIDRIRKAARCSADTSLKLYNAQCELDNTSKELSDTRVKLGDLRRVILGIGWMDNVLNIEPKRVDAFNEIVARLLAEQSEQRDSEVQP